MPTLSRNEEIDCDAKGSKESENCQGSPGNSAIDNELHKDIDNDALDSCSEENLSDTDF